MFKNQQQIELDKEFKKYLNAIFSSANADISISPANNGIAAPILNRFYLFKAQQNSELLKVWTVKKDLFSFTLCSVAIDSTLKIRGKYSSLIETQTHTFLYGLCKTEIDFGESLIRPETIEDKITEIFQKKEIDFPSNKKFSSKYFCLSKDENKFRVAMSPELMSFLENHSKIEIEFNSQWCLFRTEKSIIDKKGNLELLQLGIGLSKILNPNNSR